MENSFTTLDAYATFLLFNVENNIENTSFKLAHSVDMQDDYFYVKCSSFTNFSCPHSLECWGVSRYVEYYLIKLHIPR